MSAKVGHVRASRCRPSRAHSPRSRPSAVNRSSNGPRGEARERRRCRIFPRNEMHGSTPSSWARSERLALTGSGLHAGFRKPSCSSKSGLLPQHIPDHVSIYGNEDVISNPRLALQFHNHLRWCRRLPGERPCSPTSSRIAGLVPCGACGRAARSPSRPPGRRTTRPFSPSRPQRRRPADRQAARRAQAPDLHRAEERLDGARHGRRRRLLDRAYGAHRRARAARCSARTTG